MRVPADCIALTSMGTMWRAGVLPRDAALLVILGSWFGLAAVPSTPAFDLGGVIFGLGNAWLGYAVWSGCRLIGDAAQSSTFLFSPMPPRATSIQSQRA
jgi:hypothetical protein